MRAAMRRLARTPRPGDLPPLDPRAVVLGSAAAMVLAHVGFRTWAVWGGFFYGDDYQLVREGREAGLSAEGLVEPYAAQFMPVGRFLGWLGGVPDHLSWPLLAATSIVMQAVAAIACLWMLVTLFGVRGRVLVPLALYLSTAMTMPAFMWWAAALNQVPMQAVFFAAVAAWVNYLRSRRLRWLAVTLLVLAFGLCCYVKTLLVFPVLAFVAVAYFAVGGPVRRVVTVLRRYWPAVLAGIAGGVAFLVYYVVAVPQISSDERPVGAAELAGRLVGDSFTTALFGGPWHWDTDIAPVSRAVPPTWAVHLCWTGIALVVIGVALRRDRTLRAWVLLAAYVAADYVLLLTTRAQVVGAVVGTEYRYLTDAACAVTLCLGLATMELRGADQSSRTRAEPLLARAPGPRWIAAATVLVAVSGTLSSWAYARVWHVENPGKDVLAAARDELDGFGALDLADQPLPSNVSGAFGAPYNLTSTLLPMLTPAARFPDSTDRLHLLTDDGRVLPAEVDEATAALRGPVAGCGWRVRSDSRVLPLETRAVGVPWWLRIEYLSSGDTGLRVTAGGDTTTADLTGGLGTVLVRIDAEHSFGAITLDGLDPGVTLCVDELVVGQPETEEDR
ncbi:hypothetical protein [Nocardioides deserti]|uniref:Glycosyltransferase RgtA/B/C/D-like domain-containing protein n=1 Tax=Nocardioides deserti TaxID=1588644 RepID=A0ABR6U352_9ACTN|nr:hypothetical protein [Nocardioides deserti]MBC2958847.1 hypothetical protein [Nocardioides deserti]